jgi:hypothetical protein
MYTPLYTVHILFETFFVYVKMRELLEVAELGGTLCITTWSKVFLEKRIEYTQLVKTKPEGSLPCSQEPATGFYPESDESNPYSQTLFAVYLKVLNIAEYLKIQFLP